MSITTHEVKTDPATFNISWQGYKDWEVRKDDRDGGFQVGDILHSRETQYSGEQMREKRTIERGITRPLIYTGREMKGQVLYKLTGYGLEEGWCILSIAWVGYRHVYPFPQIHSGWQTSPVVEPVVPSNAFSRSDRG